METETDPAGRADGAPARRWWTLFAMSGALTMIMLDGTGVSVALPRIQEGLGLDEGQLQWVITAYSLTLAAMLATGGRLGDQFGRVRAFVVGVCLFSAGSLTCALAPNLPVLVGGRVLAGLGNVLMGPAAAVLVTEAFPPNERGKAMGLYTALGSSFMAIGPLVGGALVEFVSWRAVFLVNLPLAVIILVLVRVARPVDVSPKPPPLNLVHTALLVLGLTALILGLQESHRWHWLSPWTLGLIGAGLILLTVFVQLMRRAAAPLLDVRLFLDRGFTADTIVLFCAQFALTGQVAYNAIYLQRILEFAPLRAGTALLLFLVPWMAMAPVAGWLYDRYGVKVPAVLGLSLITLGFFLETQTFPHREFLWIVPAMMLIGMGLGLAMPQSYTDGMGRVGAAHRGQAFGMLDTMRQFGAALGMSLIGTVVAGQALHLIAPIAERHATAPADVAALNELLVAAAEGQPGAGALLLERAPAAVDELRTAGARSIAHGYYLGTAVTALGLVLAIVLMRRGPPAGRGSAAAADAVVLPSRSGS